jgi:hypothetical protein
MRQLGNPPDIDLTMTEIVREVLKARGVGIKDADASTGGKDFLERILGLIRSTGFTIAIFSNKTRMTAMANIALARCSLRCGSEDVESPAGPNQSGAVPPGAALL